MKVQPPLLISQSNPQLHKMYVGYAVLCLRKVDNVLAELCGMQNASLDNMIGEIKQQRAKLVETDEAYADADTYMNILRTGRIDPEECSGAPSGATNCAAIDPSRLGQAKPVAKERKRR